MLSPPEPGSSPLAVESLLLLAAVAVAALWVLRRLLRALLVVAAVTLIALPIVHPMLPRGSESRSQRRYVADGSVFVDRPAGRPSCRTRIDRRYLGDPSLTLLVPTPAAELEAAGSRERGRLRARPGGARIRLVVESEPSGRAGTGQGRYDAVAAATARRYRVPLLTADPPTSERRRLWRGLRVVRACPG